MNHRHRNCPRHREQPGGHVKPMPGSHVAARVKAAVHAVLMQGAP
ncbi:MAG: hypothetical protein WCZ18_04520 [Ottowia sp.]